MASLDRAVSPGRRQSLAVAALIVAALAGCQAISGLSGLHAETGAGGSEAGGGGASSTQSSSSASTTSSTASTTTSSSGTGGSPLCPATVNAADCDDTHGAMDCGGRCNGAHDTCDVDCNDTGMPQAACNVMASATIACGMPPDTDSACNVTCAGMACHGKTVACPAKPGGSSACTVTCTTPDACTGLTLQCAGKGECELVCPHGCPQAGILCAAGQCSVVSSDDCMSVSGSSGVDACGKSICVSSGG